MPPRPPPLPFSYLWLPLTCISKLASITMHRLYVLFMPFYLTPFHSVSFWGGGGASAPTPPLQLSYIFCIKTDNFFHFHFVCLFSRCTYTHVFSLISIIMSCIKYHHMDVYACIIFFTTPYQRLCHRYTCI